MFWRSFCDDALPSKIASSNLACFYWIMDEIAGCAEITEMAEGKELEVAGRTKMREILQMTGMAKI